MVRGGDPRHTVGDLQYAGHRRIEFPPLKRDVVVSKAEIAERSGWGRGERRDGWGE